MLSATPVNNRFNDLRNQLALAYEGDTGSLNSKLRTSKDIDEIFRKAQTAFNTWTKLPPDERTPGAILAALDFDFFELLDSVTIARSRKHIETFYDTSDIGNFRLAWKFRGRQIFRFIGARRGRYQTHIAKVDRHLAPLVYIHTQLCSQFRLTRRSLQFRGQFPRRCFHLLVTAA